MRSTSLTINVFLAAVVLTGCSATHESPEKVRAPTTQFGQIVGSVSYEGLHSVYAIYFRDSTGLERRIPLVVPFAKSLDEFETGKITGRIFVERLPPGVYEVHRWTVGIAGAGFFVFPTRPFSVKFTVSGGKTAYIGSFAFTPTDRRFLSVIGARLDYRDEFSRDLSFIHRAFPALKSHPINNDFLREAEGADLGGPSENTFNAPLTVPFRVPR